MSDEICRDVPEIFSPVRLQSNGLPARNLLRCRRAVGLATHSQMSKMRMRKHTQKRVSADFANVEVRLDAPWSVQPHRWKFFARESGYLAGFGDRQYKV